MLKYVLRRLAETIPTTIGILLLTFALFNVVGGSPAEVILGKNATAESVAAFNRKWGYDKPLIIGMRDEGRGIRGWWDSQFLLKGASSDLFARWFELTTFNGLLKLRHAGTLESLKTAEPHAPSQVSVDPVKRTITVTETVEADAVSGFWEANVR